MIYIEYPYYKRGLKNWIINTFFVLYYGVWKGCAMIIDVYADPFLPSIGWCDVKRFWVDWTTEKINEDKYKIAKGFNDSLLFLFVPQYIRIHNMKAFDVSVKDPATGVYIYSQDTASTLHDAMVSQSDMRFRKGMSKVGMQTMDIQTIIMIVIVGVGAIFGLHMLGVF